MRDHCHTPVATPTDSLGGLELQGFLRVMEQALEAPECTFSGCLRLTDLPGWDSLSALATIATIDHRYGVTLDNTDLRTCDTLADLAAIVDRGLAVH
ncbi:MAG: hypothetical protein GX575_19670 [Candidatus Anammoximicrobium sp.]|nr:hypothetical protein [Candidatus Anammoximicrobium sp.]